MTTSEKVAYLKGLADGLGLDKDSKQDKLIAAIIDVLDAVAQDIEDLEENALDLSEEIDAISDDLADIESIVYDEYDEDCCCHDHDDECCCGGDRDYDDECCCGDDHHHHHDDECCTGHHHHDHHECCCSHHGEAVFYEVTCPACKNTITVDGEVLELGAIQCPSCGETLEFDLDSIEYEEDAPEKE